MRLACNLRLTLTLLDGGSSIWTSILQRRTRMRDGGEVLALHVVMGVSACEQ